MAFGLGPWPYLGLDSVQRPGAGEKIGANYGHLRRSMVQIVETFQLRELEQFCQLPEQRGAVI